MVAGTTLAGGNAALADSTESRGAGLTSSASGDVNCLDLVEAEVEASGLDGEPVDFACGPMGATVEQASPGSIESAERQAAETAPEADRSNARSAAPCNILAPTTRTIQNAHEEDYEVCVIYGQRSPSGSIVWSDGVRFEGTNWPAWSAHRMIGAVDDWYTNNGSLSFETALFRNAAGFFLEERDFIHHEMLLNNGMFYDDTLYNSSSTLTGVYHLRIRDLQIEVPLFGFSRNFANVYEGFRFLCNESGTPYDQCEWPDGEEAPWFG